MEIFYGHIEDGGMMSLPEQESAHCVRVLRHRAGDTVYIIDGEGTMYECRIMNDSPKGVEAQIIASHEGWGSHPYHLTAACCPTKNNERYEWFVEKAIEMGVDRIVPVIGSRSERRVFNTDRVRRIALSAVKQSLKSRIPDIDEPVSMSDFLAGGLGDALGLIAVCYEPKNAEGQVVPRVHISEALSRSDNRRVVVLVGPEGDFSPEEASAAIAAGYIPVNIGTSRLRTETAGMLAVASVYLSKF
ncbi:MAG: 16S rRNA (uracil(1498)-N(3))-methyltransferase [Bacteroidales bacterium]|nr:16S rRNA (uracil(1498)-N(3))-methyltransferase [Bacteroidales bacterium]